MKLTTEEARIARTETVFRHVNERIAETADGFGSDGTEFVCECADSACHDRFEVSLHEYERVREKATRFLVALGHDVPRYERVVQRRPGYAIVEKFTRGLVDAVRRSDPRAGTA